jgi:Fe-S-cluster containining protein
MLPRIYQHWISDWLGGELPEEKLSTCHSCAMSPPPNAPKGSLEYFGPNKCCTYFPSLPNFQVGGVLRDAALTEGAERVTARIHGKLGVDPLAVRAPRKRAELYRIGARAGFGRADTYRCPYYGANGGCTIWAHREAVCSTYFCKFESPVHGRDLWTEVKGLLSEIEVTVAIHCAMELGIAASTIDSLLESDNTMRSAADVDERPDDDLHAKLWGTWLGRELDYYSECARVAQQLDLDAIRTLGGQTFARRLAAVRAAYSALASAMPERLRMASSLQVSGSGSGKLRILAGPNQPIEMPAIVMELLTHFQGQPLVEATAALEAQGFDFDHAFLEKLWKLGFLVAA